MRDTADRDEWKLSNCLANGAQSVQTEDGKGVRFAGRRENRTNGEVVDGQFHGLECLTDGVCGITDNSACAEQFSCGLGWQIVLTEMNAVGAHGKRDVNPIINDQLNPASFSNRDCRFGFFIKLQSRHPLLAKLNQRSTA